MRAVFLSFLLFGFSAVAQDECPCCTEEYQQFDFWIGDWEVKDTNDIVVGYNTIKKTENGCVLRENWTGAKGSTGTSLNYFDRTNSTWNQLWIDNAGWNLKLKGTFQNGQMVLKSDLTTTSKGKKFYHQVTWTLNEDGSVTQLWESFWEDGTLFQTVFQGIYRKK